MTFHFMVNPRSNFAKRYWELERQLDRLYKDAGEFFLEWGLQDIERFYVTERLAVAPEGAIPESLQSSKVVLNRDPNGLYLFKIDSPISKAWKRLVEGKLNLRRFVERENWYVPYIEVGECSLWDDGINIYGMLQADSIKIPDWAVFLPLSEYEYAQNH